MSKWGGRETVDGPVEEVAAGGWGVGPGLGGYDGWLRCAFERPVVDIVAAAPLTALGCTLGQEGRLFHCCG